MEKIYYDVYGIFIADVQLDSLAYGLVNYDLHRHALMCVAPGQIGGKAASKREKNQTRLSSSEREQARPISAAFHPYVQEVLWLSAQSFG